MSHLLRPEFDITNGRLSMSWSPLTVIRSWSLQSMEDLQDPPSLPNKVIQSLLRLQTNYLQMALQSIGMESDRLNYIHTHTNWCIYFSICLLLCLLWFFFFLMCSRMFNLLQFGTPWSDGREGVTQCPIVPGDTFKYKFKVERVCVTC